MNNSTGQVSGIAVSQPAFGGMTVAYNATTDSYILTDGATSRTFTGNDYDGSDSAFDYFSQTSGSTVNELSVFTPGPTNSRLSLTYTTYGVWTTGVGGTSTTSFTSQFAVSGVQTSAANMPTTGSATFQGIADGAGVVNGQAYRFAGSTGSLTANFATGNISTSLILKGNPDILSDALGMVSLGTLTGSGSIGAGTNRYTGTINGIGMTGPLNGAFFGPAAAETGYSFSASGEGNAAIGIFVGKQ